MIDATGRIDLPAAVGDAVVMLIAKIELSARAHPPSPSGRGACSRATEAPTSSSGRYPTDNESGLSFAGGSGRAEASARFGGSGKPADNRPAESWGRRSPLGSRRASTGPSATGGQRAPSGTSPGPVRGQALARRPQDQLALQSDRGATFTRTRKLTVAADELRASSELVEVGQPLRVRERQPAWPAC
jgi:hypothetical protein